MSQTHHAPSGFTLFELLTVLVIIGVVMAIGIPRLSAVRQRMTLDASARQLAGDLGRARIEALKRNTAVTLRRVSSGTYEIQYIGTRALRGDATLTGTPDSVRFASFGPPLSGPTTFTVTVGSFTKQVEVSAAGQVVVR